MACSRVNITFYLLLCTEILHFISLRCLPWPLPGFVTMATNITNGTPPTVFRGFILFSEKMIIISFDVINKTDISKGKAVQFLGGRGLLQMYPSSRPRLAVGINMFTSENQSPSNSHLKPLDRRNATANIISIPIPVYRKSH